MQETCDAFKSVERISSSALFFIALVKVGLHFPFIIFFLSSINSTSVSASPSLQLVFLLESTAAVITSSNSDFIFMLVKHLLSISHQEMVGTNRKLLVSDLLREYSVLFQTFFTKKFHYYDECNLIFEIRLID